MKGFLIKDSSHAARFFLATVSHLGLRVTYTLNPLDAMVFSDRAEVARFRKENPHIKGRVVLLKSELYRQGAI